MTTLFFLFLTRDIDTKLPNRWDQPSQFHYNTKPRIIFLFCYPQFFQVSGLTIPSHEDDDEILIRLKGDEPLSEILVQDDPGHEEKVTIGKRD